MKTTSGTKTILALVFTFLASESFAAGIGISLGSGSEEWDTGGDEVFNASFRRHDGDRDIRNFGFVMDTTIAKNRVFNYRFSLLTEENNASGGGYNVDMAGIAMTHDFGFGIVRNKVMRLWVGPQLKASFYDDISPSFSTSEEFDGDVWGYAIGPVIGLNFHLPRVVSFSVTAGYHIISEYYGSYEITQNGFYVGDADVDAESTGSFINASILFRFNDRYW